MTALRNGVGDGPKVVQTDRLAIRHLMLDRLGPMLDRLHLSTDELYALIDPLDQRALEHDQDSAQCECDANIEQRGRPDVPPIKGQVERDAQSCNRRTDPDHES
jgi:hypothetical protein